MELVGKTGMMTFPQVVVDGQLVGSFNETQAAVESGRLQELLKPVDTGLRRSRGTGLRPESPLRSIPVQPRPEPPPAGSLQRTLAGWPSNPPVQRRR